MISVALIKTIAFWQIKRRDFIFYLKTQMSQGGSSIRVSIYVRRTTCSTAISVSPSHVRPPPFRRQPPNFGTASSQLFWGITKKFLNRKLPSWKKSKGNYTKHILVVLVVKQNSAPNVNSPFPML